MSQIKENFFDSFLFKFESYSCNCKEDIEHRTPGLAPIKRFKLQGLTDHPITFGYAAKDGLVRISQTGAIEERNILGSLISLTKQSPKKLSDFLNNNGFLFPIATNAYEEIDENTLYSLIDRLRITIELMTVTSEIHKNYKKICDLTIKLLFADTQSIQTSLMKHPYTSLRHPFVDEIENAPTQLSNMRNYENYQKNSYHINDLVYGSYELSITDYNDITGNYIAIPSTLNSIYPKLAKMLVNYEPHNMTKRISDFLFHFLHEMNGNSSTTFSTEMKTALIEIAKFVIGEEINSNLDNIHPVYNTKTMTPSWKVDSLLCAAYFSIFYLKPDLEIYRSCDNPRCNQYFLVKTTSTRKKYCSPECCNRVAQDRYRKRQREEKEI